MVWLQLAKQNWVISWRRGLLCTDDRLEKPAVMWSRVISLRCYHSPLKWHWQVC